MIPRHPMARLLMVGTALLLLAAGGIFYALEGRKIGAGGADLRTASGRPLTAIYGIRAGDGLGLSAEDGRLGFVIFARFDAPGVATSSSSRWVGSATPKAGAPVTYEASRSEIDIDGQDFDLDSGRVFYVDARGGSRVVRQLDLALPDLPFEEQIERIAASPELDALVD